MILIPIIPLYHIVAVGRNLEAFELGITIPFPLYHIVVWGNNVIELGNYVNPVPFLPHCGVFANSFENGNYYPVTFIPHCWCCFPDSH